MISRPDTRTTSQAPRSQWVSFERAGLLCLAAVPAVEPHAPLDVWRKGRPDTTGSPSTRTIPPLSASLDPTAWTGAKAILLAPTCRCSCYDEGPGQAPRCEARASRTRVGLLRWGAPSSESWCCIEAITRHAMQRRSAKRAAGRATVPLASPLPSLQPSVGVSWGARLNYGGSVKGRREGSA